MNLKDKISGMMSDLMLNCNQATHRIILKEYQSFDFRKEMQLKMHLAACNNCRRFNTQNQQISHEIDNMLSHNGSFHYLHEKLDEDKKNQIKALLKQS